MKIRNLLLKDIYALGNVVGLNESSISVLCYHSISDSSDKYSVGLSKFKKQISLIRKYAQFADSRALENALVGKQPKKWAVVLTIDDGYEDVEKIIPLTKKFNISVMLFILSERIKANRKELNNKHKLLNLRKIKELHKLGWIIGCHSATHANLSELSDKELELEIVESKKSLEAQLGFNINYFAYPKGIVNSRILKFVKKAGFKMAFTTEAGIVSSSTNPLLIPRSVIEKSRPLSDFPYFLSKTNLYITSLAQRLGILKTLSVFLRSN